MLTTESIKQLKEKLSENEKTDKAIIDVISVLNEFKALETEIVAVKKLIKDLIVEKQLNKYIEINGNIYCLETLKKYELITVTENKIKEITNLEKQIDQEFMNVKEIIEKSDNLINSLYSEKEELLKTIFYGEVNKAVKTNEILIIQKEVGDQVIFLENY